MRDVIQSAAIAWRAIFDLDQTLFGIVALSLSVSLIAVFVASAFGVPMGAALAAFRFRGRQALGLPPVVVRLVVYLMLPPGPAAEHRHDRTRARRLFWPTCCMASWRNSPLSRSPGARSSATTTSSCGASSPQPAFFHLRNDRPGGPQAQGQRPRWAARPRHRHAKRRRNPSCGPNSASRVICAASCAGAPPHAGAGRERLLRRNSSSSRPSLIGTEPTIPEDSSR
jgi:hypothetical protein